MYDDFIATVNEYYQLYGRHDLPWRLPEPDGHFEAYRVLVSEIMLQQTQVRRVVPKYDAFIQRFPTAGSLARASLGDVLVAWQGLGYNRRAKFLWQAAQRIVTELSGRLPDNQAVLEMLPGVGANTAGAIRAYAFNVPTVFIETNIRTVFIYHFFQGRVAVHDTAIRELVRATLNEHAPRTWYWSLMDYGAHLKETSGNASRASKSYTIQTKFEGSLRQIRGRILKLLARAPIQEAELLIALDDMRSEDVLRTLLAEGLIRKQGARYELP